MRAKRLQTRQLQSPAKKSRQKSLPLKRGASSSRDTSPPKSVRKVQDKVDAHKKPVTKVVTKPKKDITTNESKPANKDETKASQSTAAAPQTSGNDSLKTNKKVAAKNVVDESKKKDVTKASGAKMKSSPVKKDTPKQGIKKIDEKPSSSKDEKVSKELKNLGIDQSPSSNDKTIKASISEIVKTKSRTSASQSLYGKSAIGVDKASITKSSEHGKDGGKEGTTKTDMNADEKKDLKPEMKEEKDVKPTIKQAKKESSKDSKKEKVTNEADVANTAEKKQATLKTQNKKNGVESKESSTKSSDSKSKAGQSDDKKEIDVKKPNAQDISKENAKKLKKNDSNVEQKKKSKKSEIESEQDQSKQPSKNTVKVDAKKSKAPKVTKSKKETEKESDKDNKIKDSKGPNQNVEKLDGQSNKELSKDVVKCENKEDSKAPASIVENKQPSAPTKKSKSDGSGSVKKAENDTDSPSTKASDEDANKKPPKKDHDDSKLPSVDANVKQSKKKNKSPKKSTTPDNEPKDLSKPKESRESSLASIAQTIEEVIAQAMNESASLEPAPKGETDKIAKPVKSPKTPKVKKPESGKTDGNAVKRKYVKKKDKTDDQTEASTTSKATEKVEQIKERKIEASQVNKSSGKTDKEKEGDKEIDKDKEKKAKKPAAPKKKPKLCAEETEKTDENVKLEPANSDPIPGRSEGSTNIVKVTTPEASSIVKESREESAIDINTTQLVEKLTPSADISNDKLNDDPIPITESSDSQIESTDCTIIYETEPAQTNSKVEEPAAQSSNSITNLDHADDGTTVSERIDNISSLIESPKFISEDSDDDDDDFFINLPANLTSATFSGLNIDKPIKEAHQSGSSVPPSVHIIPASTNAADDSNDSTTTSSDESIDEKRRRKKPTKVAMKKKKIQEKVVKKKPIATSKPSKASKSTAKTPTKVQPEKQVPAPMKSKISVKSLESMKNPVLEKKIKVEILSDDDAVSNRFDDTNNQPSTSSQQPKDFASIEPPSKRKYVRKKPLKADVTDPNKSKDTIDDDNNDSLKKDVYDFHESGHSSEDTCLSYKKNSKNDKDMERKKSVPMEKTASAKKKTTLPKKKLVTKKGDPAGDDQKTKPSKNDHGTKSSSKVAKAKSSQPKRKPSSSHSSSDSDDDKVLSKKFAKKKKTPHDSSGSGSESESESSDCEPRANTSTDKNRRKKSMESITGPKRHRMASLNALAKVQCLYENESRTAQELGFVKEPRTLPKEKPPVLLLTSDDETDKVKVETSSQPVLIKKDKETKKEKKVTKQAPQDTKDEKQLKGNKGEKNDSGSADENQDDEEEEEAVVSRTLRTAPGLRGAGKLWEVSMSSMESNSDIDSDESYEDNKADKTKSKKKPLPKRTIVKQSPKAPTPKSKSKTASKPKIPSKRSISSASSDSSDTEPEVTTASSSKKQSKKKRKQSPHDRKSDFKDLVVRKRMASLNASAMLAATYEVERHLDRVDSMYYGSSAESDTLVTPKKIKEIKREIEEPKESRPVSTNVVIVQDTDVTITGVYVNSSLGSSQEAYCKMQYRVQSSVTEERLVRPGTQDPPKSYTPLSALSCMLPPGSGDSIGIETQPPTIQHQPPYHHVPPHQMPPLPHHLQSHHQSPDCETPSPFRYQNVYQQSPPTQMQSSSAFCAIPQPDASGYYQPAGPLINSHLVPQSQPVSTKAGSSGLDGDAVQLQSPSTPGSESADREVLITGGTPRPQTFHYPPPGHGPYQRPIHQMHCPTYPPANYYAPYSQHPQDMCYSPPYQTYYPPKVYPSSYRRYVTPSGTYYQAPNEMYEPPPPPPTQTQSQQPPSNQQIVPTGPQHIEHYPTYYSGYSPGSGPGGCYNRSMQPPFIDSSPYQNSCPCPMQSCPKNVHTGPLIGSKTGKGPVQSNHLVAPIDIATSVTLSSNTTSASQKIVNCKTEDLSPQPPIVMVKPETDTHLYHHAIPVSEIAKSPVRDKVYEKIGHAPPNFALNTKVLEPEMSISPARGSTGLPLPPIQASATQPADNPTMVRKARVGKSMAREMMMVPQQRQALNLHVDNDINSRLMTEHTDIIMEVKNDQPLIKQENMKIECEDDVIILDNTKFETPTKTTIVVVEDRRASTLNCDESTSSTDDVEISSKRKSTDSEVINLEDSMEEETTTTLPSSTIKKRKILEFHKDPCKKSPPNSYKSLIKQSEPKPYLCNTDAVTEKHVSRGRSRYRLIRGRSTPRYRHRKIIINGKHKKVFITNRKVKRRIIKKHVTKKATTTATAPIKATTKVVETNVKEVQVNEDVKLKSKTVAEECTEEEEKTEEKRLFMSSLELTIDGVAKGYFSDQEILAKSKSNKRKGSELRSKSETKKPEIVESIESNVKMRDRSKSATKNIVESKPPKTNASDEKSGKSAKKQSKSSRVTDETLLIDDYSLNNNNNNHIVMDNNYGKVQRTTAAKKTKSRSAKFSNKKKHRVRQLQEIEDIEIPRKSTAAPRWSNGWHWEGEPFKGKVFLNSDDVQVIRTRYPAMRHDSGDVIQPGDCVLLRAGSKKNELPYVAKVASLWENPEDGEMMMSLLWYYRPEHTEQGRQSNDCPDEVFASKHQDHNSVACIEDKCYVLTFNEYCRYRKALKATEEDIVLPKPIAPCMTVSEDKVPVNTNSELVLFCRRVYEFRLKRLIKNPS